MTDEHAKFIASGYTEARWQQLLRSRERFRLKMIALRDWSYEHPVEIKEVKPVVKEVSKALVQIEPYNKSAF
jgi:hypothetical protein